MQIRNLNIPESICSICKSHFLSPGCSGALARQCTSAYPECTVTIFDLPKVVHMSRKHFISDADQRINFYQGKVIMLVGHVSCHVSPFTASSTGGHHIYPPKNTGFCVKMERNMQVIDVRFPYTFKYYYIYSTYLLPHLNLVFMCNLYLLLYLHQVLMRFILISMHPILCSDFNMQIIQAVMYSIHYLILFK